MSWNAPSHGSVCPRPPIGLTFVEVRGAHGAAYVGVPLVLRQVERLQLLGQLLVQHGRPPQQLPQNRLTRQHITNQLTSHHQPAPAAPTDDAADHVSADVTPHITFPRTACREVT